jgi:hypothetical protein
VITDDWGGLFGRGIDSDKQLCDSLHSTSIRSLEEAFAREDPIPSRAHLGIQLSATTERLDVVEPAVATRVGALESWRLRVEARALVHLYGFFDGANATKLPTTCSTSGLTTELSMAHYGSHLPNDKGGSVASWQPVRSLALAVHVESQCQHACSARGMLAMASMGKMSVGDLTEADLKGKRVFVCAKLHEPPDENQNSTNDILPERELGLHLFSK